LAVLALICRNTLCTGSISLLPTVFRFYRQYFGKTAGFLTFLPVYWKYRRFFENTGGSGPNSAVFASQIV
jgi:hypothetical protein